jgi:hypothetical protein
MYIKAKKHENYDVILNLDANEVMGEETQGISKLQRDFRLVDLLDVPGLAAEDQLKDTFVQGMNRLIFYMLGCPRVKDCI